MERVSDRYEIESRIAVGGMGIVYRARDERLGRTVALKILKDHLAHDERFVERFRREARSVASLGHPNIAALYDYGEDGDRHYIVMECVEGRDLAQVLRDEGRLSPERATHIAHQVCAALGAAHASGIVHRDVKPANILLGPDDTVKVTDFGIARAAGDSTLTATGSILGTAHYLAPEQAAGETPSPATDVYAMGVVLFEMLTGATPFEGDSPVAVATRHLHETVPAPSSLAPDVPAALDAVVLRATAKEPIERFAGGAAFAAALEEARAGRVGAVPAAAPLSAAATEEIQPSGTRTAPLPKLSETLATKVRGRKLPQRVLGWPLPVAILVALTALALALLAFRLIEDPEPERASLRRNEATEPKPASDAPSEEVTVPELEGRDVVDAIESLDRVGLAWSITGDPEGIVVFAKPASGSVVEKGAAVTLQVEAPSEPEKDDDEDKGPPDHSKGRGKDKKDKGEEEDD